MDIRSIPRGCLQLVLICALVKADAGESGSSPAYSFYSDAPKAEGVTQNHQGDFQELEKTFETALPNHEKSIRKTLRKLPGASSSPNMLDPVFNEILDDGVNINSKRGALDLYNMMKCGTGCNPLVYKGYGCYCGFLGSGGVVDGIDRCCKMHDWCYYQTSCMALEFNLPYFVPYKWTCNGGAPYCMAGKTKKTNAGSCSHQLCECDREFVECLKEFPCPYKKAMCRSPWRYWQNLFMGLGTGMPMDESHMHNSIHGSPHPLKPQPLVKYPKPKFHKNRVNIEFG